MNLAQKIFEANRDILIRTRKEKVGVNYIEKEDVLFINIGTPKVIPLSFTIADDYINVLYDPKTYEITGFTIPFVKEFLAWHNKQKENKNVINVNKISDKQMVDTVTSNSMSDLNQCAYA